MTEWKPICETPPFRERILLCWVYDTPNMDPHVELGWRLFNRDAYANTYGKEFSGEPTHWMPLPTPPSFIPATTQRSSDNG